MTPLSIVAMERKHLREVLEIERESFSTPWSEESFLNEMSGYGCGAYAALMDGEVVGYICTSRVFDEGHILNLAVAPAWRRKEIAKALAKRGLDELKAGGCLRVYLEVRVSNEAAIALYEGFGFKPAGIRKTYYVLPEEDALVMMKRL